MDRISRRQFVTSGAMALGSLAALPLSGFHPVASQAIRIGLIGTGARGTGLATLIKDMPAFQLVACCDTIPENLANALKLAAKDAKSYTDYRKLLEDRNVDAVIIATPLYLHYPMAVAALQAG